MTESDIIKLIECVNNVLSKQGSLYLPANKKVISFLNNEFKRLDKETQFKADDICVCWNNGFTYILGSTFYKDVDIAEWDNIILQPENLIGKKPSMKVKYWQNIKDQLDEKFIIK